MKPIAKVFTKDAPCTKLEIWQCFRVANGFRPVAIAEAHSYIGLNVPRILEREGRIVLDEKHGIEFYTLTEAGEEWLRIGFQRYLKNHPAHALRAKHIPDGWGFGTQTPAPLRLRRTR